jgi:glutamate synthase domain-containing protein 3
MGARSLAEVIGRTDRLEVRRGELRGKAALVSLGEVLPATPLATPPARTREERTDPDRGAAHLDDRVLESLGAARVLPLHLELPVSNADRAVGARVAGVLSLERRGQPLPEDSLVLRYRGSAGQSFGAFCVEGMRLVLTGEANDSVAKGMSGGEIAVLPPEALRRDAHRHVIAGNAVLYGATGGRLFVAGRVGERFAVRNSGALAVAEGVGDHACEYMTAGETVILGSFGRNLGAGMSGGRAYVFDPEGLLPRRYNPEMVALERGLSPEGAEHLRRLVERHLAATGSARAAELLERWDASLRFFWKVTPKDSGRGQDARPLPRPRTTIAVSVDERAAASGS